jgi:brefeldin A-inhibited guanine nucleotide-exchange protein
MAANLLLRIIEHLSRMTSTPVHVTDIQQQAYKEHSRHIGPPSMSSFPPSLSTATIGAPVPPTEPAFPIEYANKQHSLLILVEVLRSLVQWAQKGTMEINKSEDASFRDPSMSRESVETPMENRLSTANHSLTPNTPVGDYDRSLTPDTFSELVDNPEELEKAKLRKTQLIDGIRKFNFKPKRGIKALLEHGFIKDSDPKTIAEFLINTDQLSKAAVGEYLGEGDPENIAIMHAFVDTMDFTRMRFVDALRRFLQSFRLPGEAQKIDRLMLKFAERYISGNPNAFANADTAYVLAYSVIMLNTDAHSDKLKGKPRMTREEFIRNNRGINDSKDLPEEYLNGIYEEIQNNEIVLETERTAAAISGAIQPNAPVGIAAGIGQTLATIGRDLQKEMYMQASEVMANKTEVSVPIYSASCC